MEEYYSWANVTFVWLYYDILVTDNDFLFWHFTMRLGQFHLEGTQVQGAWKYVMSSAKSKLEFKCFQKLFILAAASSMK